MRYSVEPVDQIYVQGYELIILCEKHGKNMTSKN